MLCFLIFFWSIQKKQKDWYVQIWFFCIFFPPAFSFDPFSHIYLRRTVLYSFDQFFNCTSYHFFDPYPHTLHHALRLYWLKAKEPFRSSALGRAGWSRRGEGGKRGKRHHRDKEGLTIYNPGSPTQCSQPVEWASWGIWHEYFWLLNKLTLWGTIFFVTFMKKGGFLPVSWEYAHKILATLVGVHCIAQKITVFRSGHATWLIWPIIQMVDA